MSLPEIDHPRAVRRLLDEMAAEAESAVTEGVMAAAATLLDGWSDGAPVTVCTTPGCLAFVPGDTTEARALGWSIGAGEDDSVACPVCFARDAAEVDGFALEHEATEWPTAEPPPDDCVSDAVVNADVIRAAVMAERAECAALLDGLADDATGEAQMALIRAARALRRRAIVRLP